MLKYTGLIQTLILCAIYDVSPFEEKERDCGKRKEFFGEYWIVEVLFYIYSSQTEGRDTRKGTVKWMLLYGMF